jgi:hypothetical protein
MPIADTEHNMKRCICGTCPSFPGDGGFYCAKGKSGKAVLRQDCVCADCVNFGQFRLSNEYYCAQGSAQAVDYDGMVGPT